MEPTKLNLFVLLIIFTNLKLVELKRGEDGHANKDEVKRNILRNIDTLDERMVNAIFLQNFDKESINLEKFTCIDDFKFKIDTNDKFFHIKNKIEKRFETMNDIKELNKLKNCLKFVYRVQIASLPIYEKAKDDEKEEKGKGKSTKEKDGKVDKDKGKDRNLQVDEIKQNIFKQIDRIDKKIINHLFIRKFTSVECFIDYKHYLVPTDKVKDIKAKFEIKLKNMNNLNEVKKIGNCLFISIIAAEDFVRQYKADEIKEYKDGCVEENQPCVITSECCQGAICVNPPEKAKDDRRTYCQLPQV